jgi:hypothetical protein
MRYLRRGGDGGDTPFARCGAPPQRTNLEDVDREPPADTEKEKTVSLYTDTTIVQADIDRRYELAGVDRNDTHHHDRHRHDLPTRPLGAHPLAAWVARLVGGPATPSRKQSRQGSPVATGRPRHP